MSQSTILDALEEIGPTTTRSLSEATALSYPATGANLRRLREWDLARPIGIVPPRKTSAQPPLIWAVTGTEPPRGPPRTLTFGSWRRSDRTGPVIGRAGR